MVLNSSEDKDNSIAEETGDGGAGEPKVKIGESEYTPQELEEAIKTNQEVKDWSEKNGDWKSLKSDYTKKAEKLSEYEKGKIADKANDILSGESSAKDLSAEELKDLNYLRKLGVITVDQHEKILSEAKDSVIKEYETKKTEEEKAKQLEDIKVKTQESIKKISEAYKFVDPEELINYMARRAKEGTRLDADEAALLLYPKQFQEIGKTPSDLPVFDNESKARVDEPKAKPMALGSREMADHLSTQLGQKPIS